MKRRLILRFEASYEMKQAFRWYERQRKGLGEEFLVAVRRAFDVIQRSPEVFRVSFADARQLMVDGFPYYVCYQVKKKTIAVVAVFHTSRDPQEWQSRIEGES